jgi:plastocyanin
MRPSPASLFRASVTVALSVAAAACFSDAPPVVAPPPVLPQTASVEASSTANTFSPSQVTIAKGGTVTWTIGTRRHNVTFFANPSAPTNVESNTNTTASRTFTAAGSFPYNCTLHAGMTGIVIVQ